MPESFTPTQKSEQTTTYDGNNNPIHINFMYPESNPESYEHDCKLMLKHLGFIPTLPDE